MMDLGPHADFIIAAYLIAIVVVGGLIAWVVLDYRMQKVLLADLAVREDKPRKPKAAPTVEPA
jgi:heme exporter protein D